MTDQLSPKRCRCKTVKNNDDFALHPSFNQFRWFRRQEKGEKVEFPILEVYFVNKGVTLFVWGMRFSLVHHQMRKTYLNAWCEIVITRRGSGC